MTRRKLNHIICILITFGFVACAVFVFPNALGRVIEGFRDIGLSAAYYFCKMFGVENNIIPTVNDMPKFPFFDNFGGSAPFTSFPETWNGFKANWSAYWQAWINSQNFFAYLSFLASLLYYLSYALLIIVPFLLLFKIMFSRYMSAKNNDYNKDSKPLKIFKSISKVTYHPLKDFLTCLYAFVRKNKVYFKIWLFIWLFNFNVITIALEFLAYYLYFVVTFDISSIYKQVYKLVLDLYAPLTFIPLWLWGILVLYLLDKFRKKIALTILRHFEMRNRGFINARPIVFMMCGTMGANKTMAMVDMALSQEIMFKNDAFELILENDLKFPNFPWQNLGQEIKSAMDSHVIYTLAACEKFVDERFSEFIQLMELAEKDNFKGVAYDKSRAACFDYDYIRYGLEFDDKLKVVTIWDVIRSYTKLYFMYIMKSAWLVSNFSIRTDNILNDIGNFPLWNTDFLSRDSRAIHKDSRYAHILDFDSLRLGLKVLANNPNKDSFEFGIVTITEIGKERLNALELKDVDKVDKKNPHLTKSNQKNDGFNDFLKLIRHSSTVDFKPFVKVIVDEQRPEDWGANARDVCEVVNIAESGEMRLAMPFFSICELLHTWLFGKFTDLYTDYRFNRGDNTLLMYLIKGLASKLHHYYNRIYNRYSYKVLRLEVKKGTLSGEVNENKYCLITKKCRSYRYSTDCYGDIFRQKTLNSDKGLADLETYKTILASIDELDKVNSFFYTNNIKKNLMNKNNDKNDSDNLEYAEYEEI